MTKTENIMLSKGKAYARKLNYILTASQKKWGCLLFILSIVGAGLEMLGVASVLPLVQAIMNPEELWCISYISIIAGKLDINTDKQLIAFIVFVIILIYLFKNIYLIFLSYVRTKYSCKIQRELSTKMMKYYINRGYLYFTQKSISELMRGIGASASSTYQVVVQILKILSEILTILAVCLYIIATDISLALSFMAIAALSMLFIMLIFKKLVRLAGDKYHKYLSRVNKASYQAFEGIKEVLVMSRQTYFVKEYEYAYAKQQKAVVAQNVASEAPAYIIEFMCVTGLLILIGGRCVLGINMNSFIPQLSTFAVAAFRILPSLGRISSGINHISFYAPAIQEVYDNFKEVESALQNGTSKTVYENIHTFEHKIEAKDIMWKYPNNETYVLNGLNMTIEKGKAIALIGHSGAGKTTMADILLGLLQPESGDVYIDGVAMYKNQMKWGRAIGFVAQTFYLNDDTIRNNIAFGVDEGKIDDNLVWQALDQAQMKKFVESLPKGIYTQVGERGIRFSGGQRQRLAIARALYYNPAILVLDEATSALDSETETAVMESIDALQGHKTLIIIAHRLSTVKNCDIIYEVVDGKAVERCYEELIN